MRFRRLVRSDQGAPLAPLLDVVLLLLIFFVVTSSFAERQLPLDLPASEAGEVAPQEAFVVNLDVDGAIVVSGETIDEATLGRRLATAKEDGRAVELRADMETRHQHVVAILDLATRVGVERFGIAVGQGEMATAAPGEVPAAGVTGPAQPVAR